MALAPGIAGRTALTLRVQTGCDEDVQLLHHPADARGRDVHVRSAKLFGDRACAVAAGYREIADHGCSPRIVLVAISARHDAHEPRSAARDWPDDVLFRISSLEPMDCTPAIVELVARSPRIAPHFHLPLQHGSDTILAAMKRPYTAAYFFGLAADIRAQLPDASIGTDSSWAFRVRLTRNLPGWLISSSRCH